MWDIVLNVVTHTFFQHFFLFPTWLWLFPTWLWLRYNNNNLSTNVSKISARHHFELAGINVDDITLCRKQACLSHCEQKERRGHCLTCSTVSNDRQCPVETLGVKNLLNTGWQNQLIFKPQLAFHLYFRHLFWKAGFRIGTERGLPPASSLSVRFWQSLSCGNGRSQNISIVTECTAL